MPSRASHPCAHPGCPELVKPGERYCAVHLREDRRQQDELRGSSTERGYGMSWRKKRDSFLKANPICERCHRAPATMAHHIVPKRDGGSDDPINLQALCDMCHAQVHSKLGTLFGGHRGREY